MKTTKIYVGYHFSPIPQYGIFEMNLKKPLEEKVLAQKCRNQELKSEDFVENLYEKLKDLPFPSPKYAFFLNEFEARNYGIDCSGALL